VVWTNQAMDPRRRSSEGVEDLPKDTNEETKVFVDGRSRTRMENREVKWVVWCDGVCKFKIKRIVFVSDVSAPPNENRGGFGLFRHDHENTMLRLVLASRSSSPSPRIRVW
jgi:hypothetical protein